MGDSGRADRLEELDPRAWRRLVARMLVVSVAQAGLVVGLFAAVPLQGGGTVGVVVRLVAGLVLVGALVAVSVTAVFRDPYPLLRAVRATIVVIVTMLVVFASTYVVISTTDPAAFSEPLDRVGALYFSVTTATTIGYGDIAPVSATARIVVMVHMVVNVAVLGVAVRELLRAARGKADADRSGAARLER